MWVSHSSIIFPLIVIQYEEHIVEPRSFLLERAYWFKDQTFKNNILPIKWLKNTTQNDNLKANGMGWL